MLGLHFRLIAGSVVVSDQPMSSFARLGLIERELPVTTNRRFAMWSACRLPDM